MKQACSTNSTNSTNAVQSLKRGLAACRCSGVNHCSFRLTSDYPLAEDWGPGVVFIKYACINREFLPEPQTSESPGWESLSLANVSAVRTGCNDSASRLRQLLIVYKPYWFHVHKIKKKNGVKTNVYMGFFLPSARQTAYEIYLAELCFRTAVPCSGHTIARQTAYFHTPQSLFRSEQSLAYHKIPRFLSTQALATAGHQIVFPALSPPTFFIRLLTVSSVQHCSLQTAPVFRFSYPHFNILLFSLMLWKVAVILKYFTKMSFAPPSCGILISS